MQNQTSPLILTFGAADPVGAVGIQADLASFAAMGCHGLSVITALLLADTTRVEDIQIIDADCVADQARILLEDMPVAAFKIGYLGSAENVSVIAEIVSDYPDIPLVLDPFSSAIPDGGPDHEDVQSATRELLIPQSTLLLLSSVELARLSESWLDPSAAQDALEDATRLIDLGCEYMLVTGVDGNVHEIINRLYDESGLARQDAWPRQPGLYSGAGNTLSATIAAMLANGLEVPAAVLEAQEFTAAALAHAQRLGMGRLVPDRYFWAREQTQSAAAP